MTLSDFEIWLNNYLNFEKTQTKGIFWLESMRFLCEKLGNPQDKIPCIHVAGSKGKGSCSAMLSSIIEEAGYKCGVYTSPHITDFRERIGSAHSFFSDEIYEKSADELTSVVDSIPLKELPAERPLTWFELVTLFAFLCFKNAKCDFAVYEVGLGGRLDSTNVVKPLASVLMPIELEHTEFLGNTIKEIAGEKAGIIKNGVPAIISPQNYKDADEVFIKKCKEMSSECIFVKDRIKELFYKYNENGTMNVQFEILQKEIIGASPASFAKQTLATTTSKVEASSTIKINTNLRLLGKVQAFNAATATCAIKTAIPKISDSAIKSGLEKAFLPGRFEIVGNIILDGAHTVKSIKNTISTLNEVFPQKKHNLIFACAGDKDIKDIIPLFKNEFDSIIFTEPKTVRNCNAENSKKVAEQNKINANVIKDVKTAVKTAIKEAENKDIILITGSFYLVSEVKEILAKMSSFDTN